MRLIVKLGLSFFFITLVLLAMSGMSIKNISAMNKRFIEIDTSLLPSLIELQEMHLKFWIIRSDVLALISQTSPAEVERYSSNITSTMDSIRENHDRYFEIVGESEDETHVKAKELIENIDAVSRKLNTVRKEILAFIQCEERSEAISIFEKKYTPLFSKLAPLYAELMDITKADSKKLLPRLLLLATAPLQARLFLVLPQCCSALLFHWCFRAPSSGSSARIPANFRRWQAVLPLATTT